MNVLVTGGAGYIGSHTIIEIFEKTNWDVISVDNYANSTPETYEKILKITGKKPDIFELDICDEDALEGIFLSRKIDGIIHFAALKSVPVSVEQPLLYLKNNLLSLINLMKMSAKFNVEHFIFSSSCSVYGNSTEQPVSESTKFGKAVSPYAYTKQVGERIIEDHVQATGFSNFVSLRYFNPVGAHESGLLGEFPLDTPNNLVPYITQTAIGIRKELIIFGGDYNTRDGTCIRDYVHVTDIANAHLKALELLIDGRQRSRHEVFNLGTGTGVSVLEAIHVFEKVNDLKLNYTVGPRREGDVEEIYSDSSLATQVLSWLPTRSLAEMMKSAWLWQLELRKT